MASPLTTGHEVGVAIVCDSFRGQTFPRNGQQLQKGQRPDRLGEGEGFTEPQNGHLTVIGWYRRIVASRPLEEQTRYDYYGIIYYGIINNHLGILADMPLEDVTVEHAGSWVQSVKCVPKTVANIHGLISSCFQDAVGAGLITSNPLRKLALPRKDGPGAAEMTVLAAGQVELIANRIGEHYRPLLWFLYLTGTRTGEPAALEVRNVDVFNKSVRLVQAYKRTPGGDRIGPTKTKRGVRTVAIPQRLVDQLIPCMSVRQPGELVFTTESGTMVRANHWRSNHWLPTVLRANVCDFHREEQEREGEPHVPCQCAGVLGLSPTPKDLRHSRASTLIAAVVEPIKIQRRMGHESITTTDDVYGHLFPRAGEGILAVLEGGSVEPVSYGDGRMVQQGGTQASPTAPQV